MKQNRKLAALLLCGIISLSLLAGCGSSAGTGSSNSAPARDLKNGVSSVEDAMTKRNVENSDPIDDRRSGSLVFR